MGDRHNRKRTRHRPHRSINSNMMMPMRPAYLYNSFANPLQLAHHDAAAAALPRINAPPWNQHYNNSNSNMMTTTTTFAPRHHQQHQSSRNTAIMRFPKHTTRPLYASSHYLTNMNLATANPTPLTMRRNESPHMIEQRIFGGLDDDSQSARDLCGPMLEVVRGLFDGGVDYDD